MCNTETVETDASVQWTGGESCTQWMKGAVPSDWNIATYWEKTYIYPRKIYVMYSTMKSPLKSGEDEEYQRELRGDDSGL